MRANQGGILEEGPRVSVSEGQVSEPPTGEYPWSQSRGRRAEGGPCRRGPGRGAESRLFQKSVYPFPMFVDRMASL